MLSGRHDGLCFLVPYVHSSCLKLTWEDAPLNLVVFTF